MAVHLAQTPGDLQTTRKNAKKLALLHRGLLLRKNKFTKRSLTFDSNTTSLW